MKRYVSLPLSEENVREFKLGDIVYLTGEIVQLLAPAHKRALEYKSIGKELPFNLTNGAIYHAYSCLEKRNEVLLCHFLGASTSAGLNVYESEFIRNFHIRAIVGKGGMDQATLDAMNEIGCVYLAQIGGCCQLATRALVETTEIFWDDLGPNAGVKHIFKELGPLILAMDANGYSLFTTINNDVVKNKEMIFQKINQTEYP